MPGALRPPLPEPSASPSSTPAPSPTKSSSKSSPSKGGKSNNQKPPASTAFNPNVSAPTSTDPFSTNLDETWVIKGTTSRQVASPAGLANAKSGDFLKTPLITIQQPNNVKVLDLIKSLYTMQPEDLKALQTRLVEANYLNPKDTTTGLSNVTGMIDSRTLTAYESLLSDVYRYQQADPSKNMTVDDMLNEKIKAYQAGGGNTTTTSQVNLFNPLQAQSFLQGAASKLLGRDPNPGEIAGFMSALNAYQQQNPDLSTVTISPDGTKQTVADKAGITSLHGGDAAAQNYLLNDQGGDVAQHSQNVAMQSLLSMLGVGALPGMSGN